MTRLMTKPSERDPYVHSTFTYDTCPTLSENPNGLSTRAYYINSVVGDHQHTFTCHKPLSGKLSCRSAFPKQLEQQTNVVQLVKHNVFLNQTNDYYKVLQEDEIQEELVQHDREKTLYYEKPFPVRDDRLLVYNIKRPEVDNSFIEDISITDNDNTPESKFKYALLGIKDPIIKDYAVNMLKKSKCIYCSD